MATLFGTTASLHFTVDFSGDALISSILNFPTGAKQRAGVAQVRKEGTGRAGEKASAGSTARATAHKNQPRIFAIRDSGF